MANINEAPRNVKDAIFYNLQDALKQYGGKLNPDSHQNENVLLRWASEEHFTKKTFEENAAPEVIGKILLDRVKASPKSLVWDAEPNFEPAAPEFTIADINKQADEFAKKEAKRVQQDKLNNDPKKFDERRTQIEAEKKAAEEKKGEALAAEQLNNAISSIEFYRGPGRVDYARTEEIRKMLRRVSVTVNGVQHNQETLKIVKQIINRLPDDATVASVQKVVDDINRERVAAAAKPMRRDSLGYL
jgi:hypothetical protein